MDMISLPHKQQAVLGLVNSIVGSALTALGLVLQQQCQIEQQREQRSYGVKGPIESSALLAEPRYLIGLFFVVLGGASSLANDGLLPQSTLAPLTAQTILYKSLLSRWILRVPISRMHGFALITMSVGMVIATLGANLDDGVYSLQALLTMFEQPPALLYTVLAGLVLFVFRRIIKHYFENSFNNWFGLAYLTLASGLIAGWTGTLIKAVVEISISSLSSNTGDFKRVGTYCLAVLIPWLVSIKLKYVSIALAHFNNDIFMPLYQAVVIACNAVCGLFYYMDFDIMGTELSSSDVDDMEAIGPHIVPLSDDTYDISFSSSGTSTVATHSNDDDLPGSHGSDDVSGVPVDVTEPYSEPVVIVEDFAPDSNIIVFAIGTGITIIGVLMMLNVGASAHANDGFGDGDDDEGDGYDNDYEKGGKGVVDGGSMADDYGVTDTPVDMTTMFIGRVKTGGGDAGGKSGGDGGGGGGEGSGSIGSGGAGLGRGRGGDVGAGGEYDGIDDREGTPFLSDFGGVRQDEATAHSLGSQSSVMSESVGGGRSRPRGSYGKAKRGGAGGGGFGDVRPSAIGSSQTHAVGGVHASYSPGGGGGRRGGNLSDGSRGSGGGGGGGGRGRGGPYGPCGPPSPSPRELTETDFMARAVVYDPRTQSHTHERPKVRQRDEYDERSYDGSYESEDSEFSHDRSQRSDHRQHVYDHDDRGRHDYADSHSHAGSEDDLSQHGFRGLTSNDGHGGGDRSYDRGHVGDNPFRDTRHQRQQRQQRQQHHQNPFVRGPGEPGLDEVLEL